MISRDETQAINMEVEIIQTYYAKFLAAGFNQEQALELTKIKFMEMSNKGRDNNGFQNY